MARRQVVFQYDPQRYAQAAKALEDAENVVRSYKSQRFDVSQAENFIFTAKSSLERNDYDDVISCSQKAIEAAKKGIDATLREQILKDLSDIEHEINEAKSKGINMSAAEGLVQQSYTSLNNRDYENAKRYGKEALDKIKTTIEEFNALSETVKYVQTLIDKSKSQGIKVAGVENLLKQAKFQIEWGNYPQANVFLNDATNALRELDPEARKVVEAIERATKLLEDAKKEGLKVHKAEYMLKSAKQSVKIGDLEKARQNAENAEHIINKARKMAKQARELLETFEAVIQHAKNEGKDTKKAEYLLKKAQISIQQGSYGTAIDYATEAEVLISDAETHIGEYKSISEKLAEYDEKIKASASSSDVTEAQKLFIEAKAMIRAGKFGDASELLKKVDKSLEDGKKVFEDKKKAEEALLKGEKIIEAAKKAGINVSAPMIIFNEAKMVMKTGRYQKVVIFVEEIERLINELYAEGDKKTAQKEEKRTVIQVKPKRPSVQIIPKPVSTQEKKEPVVLVLKGKKKEEPKVEEVVRKDEKQPEKEVAKHVEVSAEPKLETKDIKYKEIEKEKSVEELSIQSMEKAKEAIEKIRKLSSGIDLKDADNYLTELKKAIETKDKMLLKQCDVLSEKAIQAAIKSMNEYMRNDVEKIIAEVERECADAESQGIIMNECEELIKRSYALLEKKEYKESRDVALEAQDKVRELKRQFALAADITGICQLIISCMKEDYDFSSAETYLKQALSALVEGNYNQAVSSALDVEKAIKVVIPDAEKAIDALHTAMVAITEAKEANLKVAKADYFMKHARNAIKIRNFEKVLKYAKDAKRVTAKIQKQQAQAKEVMETFRKMIETAKNSGKDVKLAEELFEKAKYAMDIGLYGEAIGYARDAELSITEDIKKEDKKEENKEVIEKPQKSESKLIAEAIKIADKRRETKQLGILPTVPKSETKPENLCPNCTKPVNPDWSACPFCRNPLKEEKISCPGCKKEIKKDWKACPYCKTVFSKKCKNCGKDVQDDWAACPYCKTKR
ncbi:MAG: zinc ribbon domain-containing protein [Thermoplasmata archaeon]